MIYKIKLKGTIEVEADSEDQAKDRLFEVIEYIEDSTAQYFDSTSVSLKETTLKTKKGKE